MSLQTVEENWISSDAHSQGNKAETAQIVGEMIDNEPRVAAASSQPSKKECSALFGQDFDNHDFKDEDYKKNAGPGRLENWNNLATARSLYGGHKALMRRGFWGAVQCLRRRFA
ncbi:unnamed protein product, partial [Amoebophrya sp. A120]